MTQAELLNYILEKEKFKKEDSAKLFGIKKKNIEKVFNGEKALNKKQIKNISKFTGLSEAIIKSGEMVLPDLQNTGVVFIDEEQVKNQNTARFENFIKTRFKGELSAILMLKLFTYFILVFGLIFSVISFYSAFIENIDKSTILIAFFTLVPFFLTFASIVSIFKITRKANVNEKGRFKIFYSIIIASLLISTIGTVIFNAFNWLYLILSLIPFVIALATLLFEKQIEKYPTKKQKLIKDVATGIILVFFIVLGIAIEFIEGARESYFAVVYLAQFCALMTATICNRDSEIFEDFSKYFGMLNKKKLYKKKRVLCSVVSALLVTTIIAGGTHFGMLFAIKIALSSVTEKYEFTAYSEYNKQNIVFSDEDETITLKNKNFTYEIPTGLIDTTNKEIQSEVSTSLKHQSEDETIMIVSLYDNTEKEPISAYMTFDENMLDTSEYEDEVIFNESLQIMFARYGETTKNVLVEKYGFAPKNYYEYQKLGGFIDPEKINYWDKEEAISHVPLLILFAVATPIYDETYFYESEKKAGILYCNVTTNEETDETSYLYHYSFDKRDSEWLNGTIIIRLSEEIASTDLAYKIINSVEIN